MQLALTGVRELSIIASPPVDRLAVRTFVTPFDPLVVREALLRERYRGGQAFYVCPRIEDLAGSQGVPRQARAGGARRGRARPDAVGACSRTSCRRFYDGKYDVLLSTTIIESGLDIPTANTLIVHRADRFGLAQLYQLRGRVGRSKVRAYALFTLPAERKITAQAERRLKVLQSLDTLGAGFQLASHDLDIRGAGNLLGEEQSGHIKEVGFELYQQMLEEAVMSLKAGDRRAGRRPLVAADHHRHAGADPGRLRRRPARAARALPPPRRARGRARDRRDSAPRWSTGSARCRTRCEQLLDDRRHQALCRRANVEKVEAGPKGAVLSFRDDTFANPEGLVRYIRDRGPSARVRPDMKVVFFEDWERPEARLKGTARILRSLVNSAEPAKAA